jgi:hypothetical protein
MVPSILTMAIGAATLTAFAALLRYVANDARELARTRARASDSAKPIGSSSFSPQNSPVLIHNSIANRIDGARRAVIDSNRGGAPNGEPAMRIPEGTEPLPPG